MDNITIIVCGGRTYTDALQLDAALTTLHAQHAIACVIDGGARGADTLAQFWCEQQEIRNITCMADWTTHGKAAGPIRNTHMLSRKPHLVVAFPGGRGTDNMVSQARAAGVPVWMPLHDDRIPLS